MMFLLQFNHNKVPGAILSQSVNKLLGRPWRVIFLVKYSFYYYYSTFQGVITRRFQEVVFLWSNATKSTIFFSNRN